MKYIILYTIGVVLAILYSDEGHAQEKKGRLNKVLIDVKYELNKPGDTLTLSFWPHEAIKYQQLAIVNDNGVCSFDLEQEFLFGVFTIEKLKSHHRNDFGALVNQIYWEAGDKITINIKKSDLINNYESNSAFSGQGSEKYTAQYRIRKELEDIYNEKIIHVKSYDNPIVDTIPDLSSVKKRLMSVLDFHKSKITPFVYDVLKADIELLSYIPAIEHLAYYVPKKYALYPERDRELIIAKIEKAFLPLKINISTNGSLAASSYFQNIFGKLFYNIQLLKNEVPNLANAIYKLDSCFSGYEKQSATMSVLKQFGIIAKESERIRALNMTFPYNLILEKFLQQSSRNVFEYTFLDTLGNNINLKKYGGKYLLVDFWYIGCGGCGLYYQNTLSKIEEEFKDDPRFAVVSISSDPNFNKWKKSIPLNRYTNEYVINLNTGPLGFSHKFTQDIGIDLYPFIILVDPNGYIVEHNTNSIRTTKELLRETLKKYLD